jgi:FlaG/FlaF family flagellin (archaellin)
MVAITVVLAAVLYVWVSGFMGGGGQTPTISLGSPSVLATWRGNITWSIVGVSRADIKWTDIRLTATVKGVSVWVDELITIAGTTSKYNTTIGAWVPTPTDYVKAGHTVTINVTASQPSSGDRIDITLVYGPTGGMAGTSYTVIP